MAKKKKKKEFLYIKKNEKSSLPKRYRKINNICAVIYDQLTEIYKLENYYPLNETIIEHPDFKELTEGFQTEEKHILDWLKEKGATDEITEVLTKHLVMSITSDFINFIYEALRCAKNGKMTVAYALLRKPLTDELLILEQLLIDRKEFINRFFINGNTKSYDPSNRKIDKKSIISNALKKLYLNPVFSSEYIHEVRYEKSCEYGLNGISNQALHIVTNDFHYRTEEQNLNFVFSTKEDIKRYREHFYSFVPYLLIYASSVIDGIIFDTLLDEDNQNLRHVKALKRLTGFMLLNKNTKATSKESIKEIFKTIGESMPRFCETCKHESKIEFEDFELFFKTELFLCQKCFNNLLSTPKSVEPIRNFFNGFIEENAEEV